MDKVPSFNDSDAARRSTRALGEMLRIATFSLLIATAFDAGATSYQVHKAAADVRAYVTATQFLMRDIERAPDPNEWPDILAVAPADSDTWRGPYIAGMRSDPWGRPYRLRSCRIAHECHIYSFGVNGIDEAGANDDVSSWGGYDEAIYFPNATRNRVIAVISAAGILFGAAYGIVRLSRFLWNRFRNA